MQARRRERQLGQQLHIGTRRRGNGSVTRAKKAYKTALKTAKQQGTLLGQGGSYAATCKNSKVQQQAKQYMAKQRKKADAQQRNETLAAPVTSTVMSAHRARARNGVSSSLTFKYAPRPAKTKKPAWSAASIPEASAVSGQADGCFEVLVRKFYVRQSVPPSIAAAANRKPQGPQAATVAPRTNRVTNNTTGVKAWQLEQAQLKEAYAASQGARGSSPAETKDSDDGWTTVGKSGRTKASRQARRKAARRKRVAKQKAAEAAKRDAMQLPVGMQAPVK